MELIRKSDFAKAIAELVSEFVLVDIGCAGGLDEAWGAFGDKLHAFGFDLSVDEVKRLAARETRPHVSYVDGMIVGPGRCVPPTRNPWSRLAVHRTLQITESQRATATLEEKTAANDWHMVAQSPSQISLPSFLEARGVSSIDFLKIDIDGLDFDVLQSLRESFATRRVLGVGMEVNWVGSESPDEHTFHNTDRFLRSCGFDLYDFTKRTYATADLPAPYLLTIPAQNVSGRPFQGDAVYLRDLAAPDQRDIAASYGTDKLLKLAALFAMIGQPDSAANVLLTFKDDIEPIISVERGLESLVRETDLAHRFGCSYRELIRAFEANSEEFYPAKRQLFPAKRRLFRKWLRD